MIKLHDMRNNGASTSKFVKDRCFMKIHHYSDQLKDSKGKHSRQDYVFEIKSMSKTKLTDFFSPKL